MYLAETRLNKNLEQYKLDVENFDLYYIKNWLDDDLRLQVKDLIDKHAFPSTITTQGSTKESDFRTSSTYYFNFNPHNRDYIELQRRITETMGIPEEYSEPLQGVKYEVGEYFPKSILTSLTVVHLISRFLRRVKTKGPGPLWST